MVLHSQYRTYSSEEGQLWAGVHIRRPEPTFDFPYEGRDLLRWGFANGQGGGRRQDAGPRGPVLSSSPACLSLPGAQACPQLNKMWQENMNQGAKEFVKLSWLLALNPFAIASRLAPACRTAFPRGRWFPPARPSEPPWEPVTAKIRDGSACIRKVRVAMPRLTAVGCVPL